MSKARESLTDTGDTLDEFEGFWRDRYDWLGSIGYQLRPRYKPGWIPSWRGTDKLRFNCEDGITVAVGGALAYHLTIRFLPLSDVQGPRCCPRQRRQHSDA